LSHNGFIYIIRSILYKDCEDERPHIRIQ